MAVEPTRRAVYSCPHCREELRARPGPWRGWLLCPRCGRPGLPPDLVVKRPSDCWPADKPRGSPVHGVFVTGGVGEGPLGSRSALLPVPPVLLVLGVMLLIVYMDHLSVSTAVLGGVVLALFGLLKSVGKRK
jgi:hypothetical protein